MKTATITAILLSLLLIGCSINHSVPASRIEVGQVKLYLPQDREIIKPKIQYNGPTNWTFEAESIRSRNNPDVISSVSTGQVLIIRELGNVAGNIVAQGVSAAK